MKSTLEETRTESFLKVAERGALFPPMMELSHDEAQMLMDELFAAGMRPSEDTGSTGQLAALQKHLEDMRAIAFTKIGVIPK